MEDQTTNRQETYIRATENHCEDNLVHLDIQRTRNYRRKSVSSQNIQF